MNRQQNKGMVLLLSLCDCYITLGGTSKVVLEHSNILMRSGYDIVFISPYKARECDSFSGWWVIYANGVFRAVTSTDDLCAWAKGAQSNIDALYIHHLKGIENDDTLAFVDALSCKLIYYVHDFASICTTTTAIVSVKQGNSFARCGVSRPNVSDCKNCAFRDATIANYRWYENFFDRFRDRLTVVAPSAAAADIWQGAFRQCGIRLIVIPHLKQIGSVPYSCPKHSRLRLAFVGVDTPEKGGDAWREIVHSDVAGRYDLYHFGTASERFDNVTYVDVDFHSSQTAMTDALLANEIDCALLWSLWPETYSFTYFECSSALAFIITCQQSGNIAAMVDKQATGVVFHDVDALMGALSNTDVFPDAAKRYREGIHERPLFEMNDQIIEDTGIGESAGRAYLDACSCSIPHGNPMKKAVYLAKRYKRIHR